MSRHEADACSQRGLGGRHAGPCEDDGLDGGVIAAIAVLLVVGAFVWIVVGAFLAGRLT